MQDEKRCSGTDGDSGRTAVRHGHAAAGPLLPSGCTCRKVLFGFAAYPAEKLTDGIRRLAEALQAQAWLRF